MVKYKEIVSMVMDMLKVTSDDSIFTEEHIIFLAGRYRSFLLKQKYANELKKQIPESNYQTLCISLECVVGDPCVNPTYLRSIEEIPSLLPIGGYKCSPKSTVFDHKITFVPYNRFRYTGSNKWLQNIIYAAIGNDDHLLLRAGNTQFRYLREVTLRGIFEDAEKASELECENQSADKCDILDRDFPLEDALIAPLIELVSKELSPSIAAPEDRVNDANDNLSGKQ